MRKLKSLRTQHNLNQIDLAELLGISVVSYRNKENCHNQFTLDEAIKISSLFNESIEQIFFDTKVYIKETNNDKNSA